ncbi:hypothetical protein AcV7_002827 [Taiwanofungus camphoratus]|nr:hypothetical protein AcV7_002827 [Antrodia cinnamomea]
MYRLFDAGDIDEDDCVIDAGAEKIATNFRHDRTKHKLPDARADADPYETTRASQEVSASTRLTPTSSKRKAPDSQMGGERPLDHASVDQPRHHRTGGTAIVGKTMQFWYQKGNQGRLSFFTEYAGHEPVHRCYVARW